MRTLIVGTGAVGGYFGGRLLAAGRDITFFVRPQRASELAGSGLRIVSPHGNLQLDAPPTITREQVRDPFDLIIVGCKAQDLPSVMDSFRPAVGPDTAILPLLNGMRHLDTLEDAFGAARVLGGLCMISATRNTDGHIVQLTEMQSVVFGERDHSKTARIAAIDATLGGAGFNTRLSENVLQDMWDKWVFITTGAGITCIMRASIGDIVAAGASDLTLALLAECAAVAEREGFPTPTPWQERTKAMFTESGSPLMASMLRDVENRSKTEFEHIVGDLYARAQRHGLPSPLLKIADAHLRAYEARRARGGLA